MNSRLIDAVPYAAVSPPSRRLHSQRSGRSNGRGIVFKQNYHLIIIPAALFSNTALRQVFFTVFDEVLEKTTGARGAMMPC